MTEKPIKKADLAARRQDEDAEGGQDRYDRDRDRDQDRDRRGGRGKKGDRRKGRDNTKEKTPPVPPALIRGPKPSAKPKVTEVAPSEEPEADAEAPETEAEAAPPEA